MISSKKKICLLICSSVPGLQKSKVNEWLKQMPEAGIIAEIDPVFVFGGNSVDVTPEIWIKLAEEIKPRINQYAGFVVIHGIDNLLYTSAALSFLLQNLTKPVIFTGSQAVGTNNQDFKKLGIKANLINALQVVTYNLPEVCLMFGNRLLRANQASRIREESLNVFTTPDSGILGRIDFSIRIFDKIVLQNKGKVKLFNQLNSNIEIISPQPILDLKALTKKITDRDGIIVYAGYYQSLPDDLVFLFEKITKDTPVIIWSQDIKTSVLGPKNILIVNNMTWPTTVVKLIWALTQSKNIKHIRELIARDIAGEILL